MYPRRLQAEVVTWITVTHTHTPPGPKCNPLAAEKVEASAAGLESFY